MSSDRPTVAVVTGGAGGMGLATAELLGRDHHVLVVDVDEPRLDRASARLAALGLRHDTLRCDITDRSAVGEAAARAQRLGTVATVVHTAGLSPHMGDAASIIRVNALGTVHVTEAFLPLAHPGLSIVNVASSAGHLPGPFPVPHRAYRLARTDPDRFVERLVARCHLVPERLRPGIAYALSKHFVIWWSRHRAGDLGAVGARIVSVSPGSFDTEMGRLEERSGSGDLARLSALGRPGAVEEIAAVLAFLAGPAPGYLTGTDVLVDGGAQAVMTLRDILAMARKAT